MNRFQVEMGIPKFGMPKTFVKKDFKEISLNKANRE